MAEAIAALKAEGAVIVDPANIPSVTTADTLKNILYWNTCSGWENRKGHNAECSIDFNYGMKHSSNAWLARSLGSAAQVAHRTPLVQHRERGTRCNEVGDSRSSISRMKWTSSRTRRSTTRTAARTSI